MHGRVITTILLGLIFILGNYPSQRMVNAVDFSIDSGYVTKDISEFSTVFKDIPYIKDVYFSPTYLSDNEEIIGEGKNIKTKEKFLFSIDIKNQQIKKLIKMSKSSEFTSFIIHFVYGDNIIFEEFDQLNQTATYFDLNMKTNKIKQIYYIDHVTPIHYTQLSKNNDKIIFNLYDSRSGVYKMYMYHTKTNKMKMIEERNSSHPVFINQELYYIVIDNENSITKIIKNDLKGSLKEIDSLESKEKFFFGIYADNNTAIKLVYDQDIIKVLDLYKNIPLYKSTWMETINYKNGYISFLGDKLNQSRVKPQYFLIDTKNKINYKDEDGMILMSKSGVLWIKFKKPEGKIEKGKVFSDENSVMRYFKF